MKLEVGMYVRTKKGIAKIVEIFDKDNEPYDKAKYRTDTFLEIYYDSEYIGDADIIGEPSYNTIKLLQVGDYVNGYPVDEIIEYGENTRAIVIADDNKSIIWEESSQYIKSIVTREQFESMSYKVGV